MSALLATPGWVWYTDDMFFETYLAWFSGFPPSWAVFLIATLPIGELRAAIPVGISFYYLPVWWTYIVAVAGTFTPAIVLLWLLDPVAQWCGRHNQTVHRLLVWWFKRVEHHFFHHYERWGAVALILFVSIPLPLFGAWTGAAAAWLFRIPRWHATGYIAIGVLIMGLLVTGVTVGAIKIITLW